MAKQAMTVTSKTKPATVAKTMDQAKMREMIASEAYLRAEKRGFNGGDPVQDWLEAEKKVSEKLQS